ncbi:hypothetical protein DYBT9623_01892 [Dyadobacter sp. CECT 9623]|jgi:uncharacterized protein (DUF2147 family)|uniref:DUF2147 domain-containing protein n=1 Tax=Dyadobacter linearis TaxID=2823330 RepID=A0ABM8UNW0_9BACT|nr:DUF2147 domain-containing protein [Dyadobacter sp. CECT 9623]CAG5069156.1 hypothetical protein DYBT9623_01892 [Dyadobacter sp. CECT 9623]
MYRIIFTTFLLCASIAVNAQTGAADKVIGEWLSEEKDRRIEIYKSGSEYFGRLIWSTELFESDGKTSRKDIRNNDEKLRDRNLQNVNVLSNFIYDSGMWDNGKMYDPQSGKTYNCLMKLRSELLEIRSYIGFPLLGKSTYWKRTENPL